MAGKMNAAVVEQFDRPLVISHQDIPTTGPTQILVKTEACGVCHTDQPLSANNTIFERLQRGDVPSRVVLELAHT